MAGTVKHAKLDSITARGKLLGRGGNRTGKPYSPEFISDISARSLLN